MPAKAEYVLFNGDENDGDNLFALVRRERQNGNLDLAVFTASSGVKWFDDVPRGEGNITWREP